MHGRRCREGAVGLGAKDPPSVTKRTVLTPLRGILTYSANLLRYILTYSANPLRYILT